MSKDIHLGFGTEGVQFTDYPQLHHLDAPKTPIVKRVAEKLGIPTTEVKYVTGTNPLDCSGLPLPSGPFGVGKTVFQEFPADAGSHDQPKLTEAMLERMRPFDAGRTAQLLSQEQLDQIGEYFGLTPLTTNPFNPDKTS